MSAATSHARERTAAVVSVCTSCRRITDHSASECAARVAAGEVVPRVPTWCACATPSGFNFGDEGHAWCNDCGRAVRENRAKCCGCGDLLAAGSSFCPRCSSDDLADRRAITTMPERE